MNDVREKGEGGRRKGKREVEEAREDRPFGQVVGQPTPPLYSSNNNNNDDSIPLLSSLSLLKRERGSNE